MPRQAFSLTFVKPAIPLERSWGSRPQPWPAEWLRSGPRRRRRRWAHRRGRLLGR